jgi:hypothetical protein
MLQMLPEVIGPEELLSIIALPILMHSSQMLEPGIPIRRREIGEFLAAVAACIVRWTGVCLAGLGA